MANKSYSVVVDSSVDSNKYIVLPADFDTSKASDIIVEMDGANLTVSTDYDVTRDINTNEYIITWEVLSSSSIALNKTLNITYPCIESDGIPTNPSDTPEEREENYNSKMEAANIDITRHFERRVFPRWSLAKMTGNHRTEGEFMYAKYEVDRDKYFNYDVIIDDYPDKTTGKVDKERNLKILKYPTGR